MILAILLIVFVILIIQCAIMLAASELNQKLNLLLLNQSAPAKVGPPLQPDDWVTGVSYPGQDPKETITSKIQDETFYDQLALAKEQALRSR